MALEGLVRQLLQAGLPDHQILFRTLRPGIEQGPLHVGVDLGQFPLQPAPGIRPYGPGDQSGRRDGGLDLVDPLFHILPILPLGRLRLRHRAHHGLARLVHQGKQLPFPEPFRLWGTLRKQLLLVQPLHNGL